MSFSPVFHSDCKKCNSIWWLLIASLYLCIYLFGGIGDVGGYHCEKIVGLRIGSQIWLEYKLKTASCYSKSLENFVKHQGILKSKILFSCSGVMILKYKKNIKVQNSVLRGQLNF